MEKLKRVFSFFGEIIPWLGVNFLVDGIFWSVLQEVDGEVTTSALLLVILLGSILLTSYLKVLAGVKAYTIFRGIKKQKNRTFFMAYLLGWCYNLMSTVSVFAWLFDKKSFLVSFYFVYLLATIGGISGAKPIIDEGGDEKSIKWSFVVIVIVLIMFNQYARDFVELLTWFLPIILYNILAGLKELRPNRLANHRFNQLVYDLTIYLFLTLVMINFINIISYDSYLIENQIVEVNRPRKWLFSQLNLVNKVSNFENFLYEFTYSGVAVIVSGGIAIFLGNMIKRFLKKQFLHNRQYFEQQFLVKGRYRPYDFNRPLSAKNYCYKGVISGITIKNKKGKSHVTR